ncbi:NADP-dependent oxidoreductase [Sphingomonas ginkgonis]|uniref:NADP-dependent oxidoreductase n=1 Tax=Sphingomonas ginkgonis TaxID=2315330 RepID=A0A429VBY3_9SPHN|nr:NADP-dependent oxidoreductase [Sphingomonas ginkgonis]RST31401.1 NADP-dependent oxidoreductase [Sphingomonas ginkgonis]
MAQAWHLMSRPQGTPTAENFALKEASLPPLEEGMVHVRNRWLSVDPYMRGRMNDVKSYVPPFQLDQPMEGGAVAEVVESRDPSFAAGDLVMHMAGWRDEAVLPAKALNKLPPIPGIPPEAFLGNLGLTGGTAYFGLLAVAEAKEGDTVFVSAAAGAVGSAVVQIAKAKGMTVIGSAGGPDKCDYVRSLGADSAIDYRAGPLVKSLGEAAPHGIDVYFDNVGGDHLDSAFAHARNHARFAICGMIGGYNAGGEPAAFRYVMRIIAARIRVQGFIWTDYMDRIGEFYRDMGQWIAAGQVKSRDTVVQGLDRTPEAFLGLFSGANTGKMLIKL